MSIKIAIFELGSVPDEVKDKYPGYSEMIQNWLSPFMPEVVFTRVLVVDGEAIPDVENFDGFIYSGSKYGVYDDIVWIHPLEEFIRNTALLNKPQFGICFGHQIIAQALGGKAVKSDRGWGCGMYEYESAVVAAWAADFFHHELAP
ncbi:MAG: glutamine amidotransferase-related protein [Arenicellales bacterium WSBS_2016_MAG_OTU3]